MEILSNLSISLNATDPNSGGFGNSMMSGNSFSYALEAAGNHSVQKQYLDMVKKQQKWMIPSTENPIVMAAMNNKKEVTLIETKDQMDGRRSIDHIDRKYIIPLALKVATPIATTSTTTTTTTSTRKPPILPDTSPNIDDLKRHILMLQNLTKNDENFQSKFVVFPNLQRPTDLPSPTLSSTTPSAASQYTTIQQSTQTPMPSTTERITTTRSTTKRAVIAITTKRRSSLNVPKQQSMSSKEEPQKAEKITIVPQVFLQNDQTPMNDDSFERPPFDDDEINHHQKQSLNSPPKFSAVNDPKPAFLSSSTKQHRAQYTGGAWREQKQPKKNTNANRNKEKQLRREMRKKCKEAPMDQKQNCTKAFQISFNLTSAAAAAAIRNTKTKTNENQSIGEIRSNGSRPKANYVPPHRSVQPPYNSMASTNRAADFGGTDTGRQEDEEALKQSILQRTIRSHRRHQRRNASTVINSMARRDHPYSIGTPITTINETVSADVAAASYKEKIDLNPDLCYKISGLSYGQQKLCASNTQIMPAISRGARAAIQVI